MIDEYHFGSIKILGETYNYDVELRWTGEILKWWRRESHVVDIDDVKRAVGQNPKVVIIGTGSLGLVNVTQECQEYIAEKGIRLIIDKTEEAVKSFNKISEKSNEIKIIGLFHLTC